MRDEGKDGKNRIRCQGKGLYHKLSHDFTLKLLLASKYISTYSVKCRVAVSLLHSEPSVLLLPLIWTSSSVTRWSRQDDITKLY